MKYTEPIKKNYEFVRAYKKGRFQAGKYMVLYVRANNFDINRLGISVGKKIGKSVKRNRVKRLIRENYRLYETCIKKGYDCIFVARSTDRLPDFGDIRKEMKFLMKKLDIFDQEIMSC